MATKRNIDHEALLLRLLKEYDKKLYHLCKIYYPFDSQRHNELYREAVYRIWRSLGRYRTDADPWPWMIGIVYRTAASMRRRTVLALKTRQLQPDDADIPDLDADSRAMYDEMYRLIDMLDTADRTLVYLYIERMPQADIAERLGISMANVSTRINRIKKKLKTMHENGKGNI